jgi:hypothetical protein
MMNPSHSISQRAQEHCADDRFSQAGMTSPAVPIAVDGCSNNNVGWVLGVLGGCLEATAYMTDLVYFYPTLA